MSGAARGKHDALGALADAVGIALAEHRAEVDQKIAAATRTVGRAAPTGKHDALGALADAVGISLAEAREATSAEIAEAVREVAEAAAHSVAAADARRAVLVKHRTETLAVLHAWLARCIDDAA